MLVDYALLRAIADEAITGWRHSTADPARYLPARRELARRDRDCRMLRARQAGATLRAAAAEGGISVERLRQIEAQTALAWKHATDPAWRSRYDASRPAYYPCPWCHRDA